MTFTTPNERDPTHFLNTSKESPHFFDFFVLSCPPPAPEDGPIRPRAFVLAAERPRRARRRLEHHFCGERRPGGRRARRESLVRRRVRVWNDALRPRPRRASTAGAPRDRRRSKAWPVVCRDSARPSTVVGRVAAREVRRAAPRSSLASENLIAPRRRAPEDGAISIARRKVTPRSVRFRPISPPRAAASSTDVLAEKIARGARTLSLADRGRLRRATGRRAPRAPRACVAFARFSAKNYVARG